MIVRIRQRGFSGAVAIRAIHLSVRGGGTALHLRLRVGALPCGGSVFHGFLSRSTSLRWGQRALQFIEIGHVVVIPEFREQRRANGAFHRPLAGRVNGDQYAVGHVPRLAGGLRGNQLRGRQHLQLTVDIHGDGWLLDSLLRNGAHPAGNLWQGLAFLHGHVEVDHGTRPFLGIVCYRPGRTIGHGDELAGGSAHLGGAQSQHHHGAFHIGHAIEADVIAYTELLFRKNEKARKKIRDDGLGAKTHGGRNYRRRHRRAYRRHANIGQRGPNDQEVRDGLHDVYQRTGQR